MTSKVAKIVDHHLVEQMRHASLRPMCRALRKSRKKVKRNVIETERKDEYGKVVFRGSYLSADGVMAQRHCDFLIEAILDVVHMKLS